MLIIDGANCFSVATHVGQPVKKENKQMAANKFSFGGNK
jgi:hypothetical protein